MFVFKHIKNNLSNPRWVLPAVGKAVRDAKGMFIISLVASAVSTAIFNRHA